MRHIKKEGIIDPLDPSGLLDTLSISIVVYRPNLVMLDRVFETLAVALQQLAPAQRACLYFIDNGGPDELIGTPKAALRAEFALERIAGHGNVGYGRGHNLGIERTHSRYHLVLNPDIELDERGLIEALSFLDAHSDTGLLTPLIRDDSGEQQFLCRRFPTVLDLFARGFLPSSLRRPFAKRLAHYEMRDVIDDRTIIWDPPIVSGCFMLFRTDILKRLNGFDPRYFLYFEDYDLSLRTHEVARVAYVPAVRVLHHGGGAARKGGAHVKLFASSAFRFFTRFGWKWL
ncbi:glycosyltransferase family 2 protein [Caballeronia sordidicola]|uniref:glycosyltransferase family 2 protein n=1 Tax=Caballeronia sordidicola TaxID=196367 RepID=UPI0009DE007D|nr:glycosyltransferase family 2 protein [Caballeronia sordidicola]